MMNKQLTIILLLQVVRMFMITMPIIVIYWQSHGLRMQDVFVLQVIFSVAVVILEVPSGYFADKFGRVTSIRVGSIAATFGFFSYWALPSFAGFILAELLLALSVGFFSGAKEALLKESLHETTRESNNVTWQGRLFMYGNLSEALAAVVAGVLAVHYTLAFILFVQWVLMAFTIPLSLFLKETRHTSTLPTPDLLTIVKGSFYSNPRLQALNLYAAGISAATLSMVWFVQPYWQSIGISISWFGWLWASLNVIVAGGAYLAPKLERKYSFRSLFIGSFLLLTGLYAGLAYFSDSVIAGLILTAGFWLLRGLYFPIITDYVQRESKTEEMATALSVNKLGARLVFSITSPFLGWLVDMYSFAVAFAASASIFGILCGLGVVCLTIAYRTGDTSL